MVDIQGVLGALSPQELEQLRAGGPEQVLDASLRDAIDRAAGGPGEGRGYYVVRGPLFPRETRDYRLRSDVAEELFGLGEQPQAQTSRSSPEGAVTIA
ncbi:hypothetical protein [Sinomonas mesophila]|uniref:hypothetical protein n=1 Tax=Sinomonas mesophila TaxID=1531955 RepID=UPI00158E7D74|nr:hypothetical protein [Sinomonas mesophila]